MRQNDTVGELRSTERHGHTEVRLRAGTPPLAIGYRMLEEAARASLIRMPGWRMRAAKPKVGSLRR